MLGTGLLRFVVQMHNATRLHYDFRIEAGGVLKSWAVPKGPSMNAQDQRLAVLVEDHPIPYGSFEGIIPKGNYGAGTVMVWDEGTYVERNSTGREDSESAVLSGIENGHVTLILHGQKLQGEFALVQLPDRKSRGDEKSWLMIKKRDTYSSYHDITREDRSVKTGRTIQEIAVDAPKQGKIWLPARAHQNAASARKKAAHPFTLTWKIDLEPQPEKIPRRHKPMLATRGREPFDGEGWLFEVDYDGYRAIAEIEKGVVHLYSKQLLPFDKKFPRIVEALQRSKIVAVLDGEVVSESDTGGDVYWVRDLLHLDGWNLRHLPLDERKKRLETLPIFNDVVRYCPHSVRDGKAFYEKAVSLGHSGILARDLRSPYVSGTSKGWLRISAPNEKSASDAPRLTHLDKVYWPPSPPSGQITKGDLVEYYKKIAPILVPHLKDRPQSLHRHPDGIQGESFFQKDLIGHRPRWVHTHRIYSESTQKSVDYLLCQNEETLLYMINLGCIELNPWLSRIDSLDRPDAVVIDLDPDGNHFGEVVEIARAVHQVLDEIEVFHLCKTSGATGIHIFIPLQAKYEYSVARSFVESICRVVHRKFPEQTSMERSPAKRRGKIYLDYLQNAQGQTVASVYCVRPLPGAPVSTPLLWEELTPDLRPESFNIVNTIDRLNQYGDLWLPILRLPTLPTQEMAINIEASLLRLNQRFPIET